MVRDWIRIWGGYAALIVLAALIALPLIFYGGLLVYDGIFGDDAEGDLAALTGGLMVAGGFGLVGWALNR